MEPQVYFFGTLHNGFSSYPGDHTRAFFEEFLKRSKNQLQIVVHREDNLLHYGYVRKFSNKFFGICICLDIIYTDIRTLFRIMDEVYANMILQGDVIKMNSRGDINWNIKAFVDEAVALKEYSGWLIQHLNITASNIKALPPADISVAIHECIDVSLEDGNSKIVNYIKKYPNIYITKTIAEVERITSYHSLINQKNQAIAQLQSNIQAHIQKEDELSKKLIKARAAKRNLLWVSILGAITLIFGVVLWNRVLFPSEVTHFQTEKYIYYGPMKNKKPNGLGVAFYPENDGYKRKYYIGHFINGIPSDTAAMLFYKDGDYFYGHIEGECFINGMQYVNSDNSYFRGSFKDGKSYNGTWYDYNEAYKLNDGQRISK